MTADLCADTVLMVRPARFGSNPLTAPSNAFQRGDDARSSEELQARALAEFDGLVAALRAAGVDVLVLDDTPSPHTPDAVFPNNWFSTHADGRVVLYPMLALNRRFERRGDILPTFVRGGFAPGERLDLSHHETAGRFLEGTGSVVFDHGSRTAFACLSPRTDARVLDELCAALSYEPFVFEAFGADGTAIYHTNVLMAVGPRTAVVCAESVRDDARRAALLARLERPGRVLVELSLAQMAAFAGNMLELRSRAGEVVLVMSQRAREALDPDQRAALEGAARLVSAPVATIEDCSGGSVRCMLAEVLLPRA